ncbi:NAD(P)-dependent alcohol dehydrogenase [Bacillus sp. JCM 19034]|uniref:NAD(P)-dependent alcohol dehydrogenase n=1 Tax=Bacillus sp. JCM 19034 TaxID=1481928 RepID=UPI0007849A0D|nr:NAD(P)-dependent alcohol dehydrogenase [Bacillus sp. JCM 19034]
MKAVVCKQYGVPEVLTVSNVPEPTIKSNELLIRIRATAANSGDARIRALDVPRMMKGMMRLILGWNKPRNPILGNVYAGTVEKIGDGVSKFQVGDRVFGSTGFKSGGYAEKIAVKATSPIAKMPTNATFADAATLPFGGQTALHFIEKLNILRDGTVLVYGASGAVGTMALQLLSIKGVQVTAVCSERNHSLVTSLGADRILDYQKGNG